MMDAEQKLCVFSLWTGKAGMAMPWRKRLCERLTPPLSTLLAALPAQEAEQLEELRVRRSRPVELVMAGMAQETSVVTDGAQMERLISALAGHSLYAYERQMAQGFIPLPDGHRAGVCGRAVMERGNVVRMTEITSVVLRIARHVPEASQGVRPQLLREDGQAGRTLLLGPPGCGKTTVLRDAALWLSDACGMHVAVADERDELKPPEGNGRRIDVLCGVDKARAMLMLVRAMAPQILITDEIGREEDAFALAEAARCGVGLVASAHAGDMEDVRRRPMLRRLFETGCFDRYVLLGRHGMCRRVWDADGQRIEGEGTDGQLGCGCDGDDRRECDRISDC